MSLFGLRSFVATQASAESIPLRLKNGSSEPFSKLIADKVPELRDGTYSISSPALFNGDLQTMYSTAGNFENINKVYYGRRIITFPEENDAIVSCDYLIPPPANKSEWEQSLSYSPLTNPPPYPKRTRYLKPEEIQAYERKYTAEDKPLLVLLHGLSGGSHEAYVRAVVDHISQDKTHPFDCVVLNTRGCARTPITTPQLFCALWTEDIRRFVRILHKEQPGRRLYLVGFSLGASILANYLGQQGDLSVADEMNKINGAAIIANPWDLSHSNQYLNNSYMGKNVYSPAMTKNLLKLVKNHHKMLANRPGFDYEKRHGMNMIFDFDNAYTAPMFGFDSAKDYYRSASSIHRIMGIKTPTLIINALDDPIVHKDCIPYIESRKNPYTILSTTSLGGHLGWFQRGNSCWLPPVLTKYFKALDENVDYSAKIGKDGSKSTGGVPNIKIDRPTRLMVGDRFDMNLIMQEISSYAPHVADASTAVGTPEKELEQFI